MGQGNNHYAERILTAYTFDKRVYEVEMMLNQAACFSHVILKMTQLRPTRLALLILSCVRIKNA